MNLSDITTLIFKDGKLCERNSPVMQKWDTILDLATDSFENKVRETAYYMWDEKGRPDNSSLDFWLDAERIVAVSMLLCSAMRDVLAKPLPDNL